MSLSHKHKTLIFSANQYTGLHGKNKFRKIKTLKKIKSNNFAHKIYLAMHNGQIHFKNLATFAVKYVRIFL